MRVLVTYGSKMGGTAGIADQVAAGLSEQGIDAEALPADEVGSLDGYDAVVVGGGLYATRWQRDAKRFVKRNAKALSERPVWFFSSGPLDDSATEEEIAPTGSVRRLMGKVSARGHVTFGGRLPADAEGFPAAAMAKDNAGDWRDPEQIGRWAKEVASELRTGPSA